ncbi:hypothetical protein [Microbulbifer sp. JMSA003]|uniref:hypothetical protein n=1 Tax=Microbulbifer sp. JMSA003 TaxID=3243369 RepID=UPI0040392422
MSYPFSKVNSKQTAPANRVEAHATRRLTRPGRFRQAREALFSRMGLVSKKPLAMTKAPSAITSKSVSAEEEVSSSLKNDKEQMGAAIQLKKYSAEDKEKSTKAEALFFSKYQELKVKMVDIMSALVECDSSDGGVEESALETVGFEEVILSLNGLPEEDRLNIAPDFYKAKAALLTSFYYKEDANVFDYSSEFRSKVIDDLLEKFNSSDSEYHKYHIGSLIWAKQNINELAFFEKTIGIIDEAQSRIRHELTPKQQMQRGVIDVVTAELKRMNCRPNQSLYELYHRI